MPSRSSSRPFDQLVEARVISQRFAIVRIALGSLLLAVAGLKLYGLGMSAIPRVGWFAQTWIHLGVAEWELLLGLWLLSGSYPRAAWLAALGTFAVFAAISARLGSMGMATCGCFGPVQASPWSAFAVDALALFALVRFRPELRSAHERSQPMIRGALRRILALGIGATLLIGLIAGVGTWNYGSLDAALAAVRGERVSVRPRFVDFGSGGPGQTVEAVVELVNRTDRSVRIIGGTSDCSCVTTNDLPIELQPGESRPVAVRVRLPATPGLFNRKAIFRTDDDRSRTIVFDLAARIDPAAGPSVGTADGRGGSITRPIP